MGDILYNDLEIEDTCGNHNQVSDGNVIIKGKAQETNESSRS